MLRRNRDFVLLQSGQLLSAFGSSLTGVAYPLLVLGLTHSPAKAGAVTFAWLLPAPLLALLAGVAADRYDRRRLMLAADGVRAGALAGVSVVVLFTHAYWPLPALAFVTGVGDVFFQASSLGALRAIVPSEQLPDAVSVQTARAALVGVVGPPIGGALFGVARAAPFAFDAVSYLCSFASIRGIRARFQEQRERRALDLRSELREGFAFLWSQPFLRVTSFLYAIGNVTIPAYLFAVVVVARRHGFGGGAIGALLAAFAASVLVGSALASRARSRLSVRAIVLAELYLGAAPAAFLAWPSPWVLTAALLPQAIVLPITDSVVVARRIALTPDALLGRVDAVRTLLARGTQPLGPLAAGLLFSATTARVAVGAFVVLGLALAAAGTASRSLNP
ncbi:MAG TPA: MFS transporter [Gaiellaceae bacterium]|nr:MFS transporter [Gaiellaceae bacterium]